MGDSLLLKDVLYKLKMTTPSKLLLKKKNRQKPAFPSRSDHDDEKENYSLGSINSSSKSSRRCSTIIAGNLVLEQDIDDNSLISHNTANVTSRKKKIAVNPQLFQVEECEDDDDLITDDDSFHTC